MTEYSAKDLRDKMKAKAHRMANGSDATGIGSSTWKKSEDLKSGVITGMRPLSKQGYKDGGSVGTQIANRDEKAANELRDGEKHIGGMKDGGKAKPVESKELKHSKGCSCAACGGRVERATGGKVGKTNINIVINTQDKKPMEPGGLPPRPLLVPPMGAGPAMPPIGAGQPPVGPAGPPPMHSPIGAGPGPMMPPGIPGRKDGGKVNANIKMTHGSGGGLGRLEKIKRYGDNA